MDNDKLVFSVGDVGGIDGGGFVVIVFYCFFMEGRGGGCGKDEFGVVLWGGRKFCMFCSTKFSCFI